MAKKLKIEIAGAGAGKTTKLAEKIIDRHLRNDGKMIYCVSFTNSSVNTIVDKLEKYYGEIPENIKVRTIHSFLNSELINPYYFILYGHQFHHISKVTLSDTPQYKNAQLSRLEKQGFLHVEAFTAKAKYVICGKSGDLKIHKNMRKNIQKLFSSYFDVLYVDEAQDIDKNFKDILIKFDELGMDVEIIGDPKQDLKGFGFLPKLVEKFPENISYIKECHRCPKRHLTISNRFVIETEQQFSPEEKKGTFNCYFESEIGDLRTFISEKKYDLKYIDQKNDVFDTHTNVMKFSLYDELKMIISKTSGKSIKDIKVIKIASKLAHELITSVTINKELPEKAINKFFPYGSIAPPDYYKLLEALKSESNKDKGDKIIVKSIESVKGLGEDRCLFIITPSIIPYVFGTKEGGKVGASLYVGLTRSKRDLDILITIDSEEKFGKEKIKAFFN